MEDGCKVWSVTNSVFPNIFSLTDVENAVYRYTAIYSFIFNCKIRASERIFIHIRWQCFFLTFCLKYINFSSICYNIVQSDLKYQDLSENPLHWDYPGYVVKWLTAWRWEVEVVLQRGQSDCWQRCKSIVCIPTNIQEAAKLKVECVKIKDASNKVSMLFYKEYYIQQQRHLLRWVC